MQAENRLQSVPSDVAANRLDGLLVALEAHEECQANVEI